MSKWYEVESSNVEIDYKDKTVSFLVCSDYDGNVYASVSFELMERIERIISEKGPDDGLPTP